MKRTRALAFLLLPILMTLQAEEPMSPTFTTRASTITGLETYAVDSAYQDGPNNLHVLLPGTLEPKRKYRVLYVLPVGGDALGTEGKLEWGTGVHAILGDFNSSSWCKSYENQAAKYGLICVFPAFKTTPWYGDNLLDTKKRHESYLLKAVLPFIERTYPVIAKPDGRFLLGFSKSGFGALGLHLRHPDIFSGSVCWDAPWNPNAWGVHEHFGNDEAFKGWNFTKLMERQSPLLKTGHVIVLSGYDLFQQDMNAAHATMDKFSIPHQYLNGPSRRHHWYSGWVPEALAALMKEAGDTAGSKLKSKSQ